jgi:serine/threonine-protein kinase RsbW
VRKGRARGVISAAGGETTRVESARVRLTIPAKPEYISLGRLALTGLSHLRDLSAETLADLKLALTEACTNSVRHAYPDDGGSVEIVYELQAGQLAIEVTDDGRGFDYHEPVADDDELAEGGLGIEIIRALSDEFELRGGGEGQGSRLRFVKFLA